MLVAPLSPLGHQLFRRGQDFEQHATSQVKHITCFQAMTLDTLLLQFLHIAKVNLGSGWHAIVIDLSNFIIRQHHIHAAYMVSMGMGQNDLVQALHPGLPKLGPELVLLIYVTGIYQHSLVPGFNQDSISLAHIQHLHRQLPGLSLGGNRSIAFIISLLALGHIAGKCH